MALIVSGFATARRHESRTYPEVRILITNIQHRSTMAAWKCSSFSLWLVTLSCLMGVPAGQLVFDADRSRICPVVNDLFASGNVSTAKECSREKPLCLDFECEFDLEDGVSTPVPLAIEAHIVPCAYTLFEGGTDQAISEVHIFVYGEGESLVLDVILEENATFVTEHTTSTEIVTIKKNITVMQQAEGIVFGMLLVVLPLNGTPVYVSVYDPILIRIPCVPPPTSSPPPPPPTSPPPSASPPPPTTPPPPTLPPVTENLALVAGVPVLSVLIVIILAMAMVLVALCVVWRIRMKRSNKSNLTYLSREDRSTDTSKRYTDIKVSGNPMFHHQLPVPLDEKEEEEEETYDEINIMRPAYGVTSIEWNYVQYNIGRSRKDEAWVYPRSKLAYLKDISQGQYAKFMLMEAQNIANVEGVMPVIVKALCSSEKLPQQSFDQELQLRKTYHHQNIVSLLGVCTDTVGLTMMVLELMDYGDLLHFVKLHGPTKFRQAVVDYSDFYNFASDISSALEYLAENGFVHGGVAAENCLVGRNLMVKLTGFSSVAAAGQESAIGEEDPYYFTMVADEGPSNASVLSAGRDALPSKKPQESEGLLRWKAPETLVYGKCTTKSDVWSFGVLLWELATYGSVPHAKLSTNDVLQNALQGTLKLSLPTHCPEDYSKVVASCQRLEPVDRPSFQELFSLLSMKADKMIKFEKNCLYEL